MNKISNLHKIGEGQDSEVYLLDSNRVLKLYKNPKYNEIAIHEMEILNTIGRTGISVPKVYEYVCTEGRPGFIMEQVYGNSIISIIEKKPYLMLKMSKLFGKSHSEIHKADAPVELPSIKEAMENCIKNVSCLSDEIIEYTIKLLKELPSGNSICHGDYNPANVIIDSKNPVFIDWGGVSKGDSTADVAHTLLIIKNGQFPPNTPSILKFIFGLGRRKFADIYFSAYKKYNAVDLSILSKWEMVRAVGRLAYGGSEERPALLKFINKCYENRNKNENVLF